MGDSSPAAVFNDLMFKLLCQVASDPAMKQRLDEEGRVRAQRVEEEDRARAHVQSQQLSTAVPTASKPRHNDPTAVVQLPDSVPTTSVAVREDVLKSAAPSRVAPAMEKPGAASVHSLWSPEVLSALQALSLALQSRGSTERRGIEAGAVAAALPSQPCTANSVVGVVPTSGFGVLHQSESTANADLLPVCSGDGPKDSHRVGSLPPLVQGSSSPMSAAPSQQLLNSGDEVSKGVSKSQSTLDLLNYASGLAPALPWVSQKPIVGSLNPAVADKVHKAVPVRHLEDSIAKATDSPISAILTTMLHALNSSDHTASKLGNVFNSVNKDAVSAAAPVKPRPSFASMVGSNPTLPATFDGV